MRIILLNLMLSFVAMGTLWAQENDLEDFSENTFPDDTQETYPAIKDITELEPAAATPTELQEITPEPEPTASAPEEFPTMPEIVESPTSTSMTPQQAPSQPTVGSPTQITTATPEVGRNNGQQPPPSALQEIAPQQPETAPALTQTMTETTTPEQAPAPQEQVPLSPTAIPLLPAAPTPTESKSIEAKKVPDIDVEEVDLEKTVGFDTLGLEKPSGNWLFKRIWWEKAEGRYEKIKGLVDQIMELRMKFFAKRNEVDNKILDPFYIEQSINQGQLEEVVGFLINELKREREQDKSLSPQERQLYETLIAEKKSLEQLRLDIESIRNIDIALDDALTVLMEQINACRSYENKSWELFKDIAKVLDHEKARALYYNMDTHLNNIKNINNYLKNAFSQHFDGLVATIQQNIARIKTAMSALQEKGINLRQQVIMLSDQEAALEKQSAQVAPKTVQEDRDEEDEEITQGLIARTWGYIAGFFKGIWDLLTFWRH